MDGGSFNNGQDTQALGLTKSFRIVFGALLHGELDEPDKLTFQEFANALVASCSTASFGVPLQPLESGAFF